MKIDVIGIGHDIATAAEQAAAAEAAGYDGYTVAEVNHDPFLPLVAAADRTSRLDLGTSIAGAFSRNPTTLAHLAWDLQVHSGGRFTLGLGPLVEEHVRHRFGMPWGPPAARMRELVQAIRAVWSSWTSGGPLQFDGDHYQLSVMPPFFRPAPLPSGLGTPDILVAAVGEKITEVAGEVADGYIPHSFTTVRYLQERTLPALARGLQRSGRSLDDLTIAAPVFVVSGRTSEELAAAVAATKQQIAFYASERTYRGVLELHGWGEAQDELVGLLQQGRMAEMGSVVDDEMLEAFAVVAEPDAVAPALEARLGTIATRVSLYTPYPHDPALWHPTLAAPTPA
ncbi:MAG TPA: TIGR03617 family F420-dependent LLM class oxidoreductase [Acidimicrobiales bacterium]|nr:TIGR03617 family F420-dependent LLM class oxidoreductase [Acidimicrobiales bacterium]